MANITFLMLVAESHLLPTFKLAKALTGRGHKVCYLTDKLNAKYVVDQGLECASLLDDLWEKSPPSRNLGLNTFNDVLLSNRTELVRLAQSLGTDLLVADAFLPAVALIAYESGMPTVMLHTNLLTGMSGRLLNDTIETDVGDDRSQMPAVKIPELILCPKELDFPRTLLDGQTRYYVEPSVDLERKEAAWESGEMDPDKPLIYCSLGTQSRFASAGRGIYSAAIEAMSKRPDLQMVISLGKHLKPEEFDRVPANVKLVNWAPQLEILKRARLMITHGGLGTVKECILLGVPMVVFPLMRDQPLNAARVVYHGLGVRGDAKSVTSEVVKRLIEQVERDESYRKKVEQMSERFKQMEQEQKGLKIIEKIISILERKKAQAALLAGC